MGFFSICTICAICMFVVLSTASNVTQQNEAVLMKNISDLHFQLFSSIQKKTKMIKTAVFETQCSGSGCTFNGCESSGSDTCDGQMIQKLDKIQFSINNIWKRKPKPIVCKTGWKGYNDHCYYLYSAKMNWFEAQVFCRKQGTSLLQINDANESGWLSKTFPNVYYWIDYTDIGTERKWVAFATGKSGYTSWDGGQPDNAGGNQDCAINNYAKRLGRWDDISCSGTMQVMCEASAYDEKQAQRRKEIESQTIFHESTPKGKESLRKKLATTNSKHLGFTNEAINFRTLKETQRLLGIQKRNKKNAQQKTEKSQTINCQETVTTGKSSDINNVSECQRVDSEKYMCDDCDMTNTTDKNGVVNGDSDCQNCSADSDTVSVMCTDSSAIESDLTSHSVDTTASSANVSSLSLVGIYQDTDSESDST